MSLCRQQLAMRSSHGAIKRLALLCAFFIATWACENKKNDAETEAGTDDEPTTLLPGLQPYNNDNSAPPLRPIEVTTPDVQSYETSTDTSALTSSMTSTATTTVTSTSTSNATSDAQLSLSESTLTIDANANTVAAGQIVNITLTLRDQYQHVFALNNANIILATMGGSSTGDLSPVQNTENGVYKATFTAAQAGTAITLTATINNTPISSALPSLLVIPGPVSPAHSPITVGSNNLIVGQSTTLNLQLRDAQGNAVADSGATVTFDLDGGGADGTISGVLYQGNGLYEATLTATTIGTASTVRAWIGSDLVTSAMPTISVAPGNSTFTVTYDGNNHNAGNPPAAATYSSGATVQVAANSGSLNRNGYMFSGWNTAADGTGTSYGAGTGSFSMGSANIILYAQWDIDCSQLVGGSWVGVRGDKLYETRDFCLQKYPASNVSNVATAQPGLQPWVSISQNVARERCMALGAGYHLINNPEWMTLAAIIAKQANNWSSGSVGNGMMARGHSDNNPANACPANPDDTKAWVDADCSGKVQGSLPFHQRRTHTFANGKVIWDFGGNILQWVDYNNSYDKPSPQMAWLEFNTIGNGSQTSPRTHFVPIASTQSWWNDSWNSMQGIGMIYPGSNGSGGALLRGAFWDGGSFAGAFAAFLDTAPSSTTSAIGFRCAYTPPVPNLYNDAASKSAVSVTTASGKSLTFTDGLWVESGAGTRILAADGSDQWAMQLNPDGRTYSTKTLNKTHITGRVCPSNVFIPGNLIATGRCLYFDGGNPAQRLDAPNNDGVTNQTTINSIRLGAWNTIAGGNGTSASWYEGNIQICATKGMRLPTLYETTAADPGSAKPIDAIPSFASLTTGVPPIASSLTWTASASTSQIQRYWGWFTNTTPSTSSSGIHGHFNEVRAVRCVVP